MEYATGERDFEDLKLLISHQKAKHFKCDKCGRRLNTAGGTGLLILSLPSDDGDGDDDDDDDDDDACLFDAT